MSSAGTVLAERRSQEGLGEAASRGFQAVLDSHLDALSAPAGLPVVICGMAGSRQGWMEAGYIDTPAELASIGPAATVVPGATRRIIILPGLASRAIDEPDVMRGEETQLLGAHLEFTGGSFYCMPGTHSKWVRMDGTRVKGFETFMTGELFATISSGTILKHSTGGEGPVDAHDPAFLTGVRDGWTRPEKTTHQLFAIRAGQLLHDYGQDEGRARLSGLLIGAECAGAGIRGGERVGLVASGALQRLYRTALSECGVHVHDIDADIAARRGLVEAWLAFAASKGELAKA
ncbi:hypothetical protein AWJ14_08305 [Hoeflea olei]|uniref:2-dehydro-3-deoxygalactonokinase n=2 Tax=Hoeflea olei TaxID=1480615 RepID=A0A1C1YUS3_9HYPH|nr:hypothetical protein AWJ14_08305 [Hoeflea olei]